MSKYKIYSPSKVAEYFMERSLNYSEDILRHGITNLNKKDLKKYLKKNARTN